MALTTAVVAFLGVAGHRTTQGTPKRMTPPRGGTGTANPCR